MKLIIVLLTAGILQVSANTYAQRITLKKKNASLSSIFKEIRKQAGYDFIYSDRMIEKAEIIDVDFNNVPVGEVLNKIFENQPFMYEIDKKVIVVKAMTAVKQARLVTGKVTDDSNNTLAGVSVKSQKSNEVTKTDKDGKYAIKVMDNTDVLTFTYIGFEPSVMPVLKREVINVQLRATVSKLEDVVITGTGIERKKESFTGATATFSGEQLKTVGNNNIIASLKALDPSFNVLDNQISGSNPNVLPDIEIRGKTGVNALSLKDAFGTQPNQPLFILDGFETSLQIIVDLDMNTVASVTILKDAASTALYGSKASNGVVVIETVKPKPGKMQFNFTNDMRYNAPDLSVYNMMNASEKLEFERLSGKYTMDDPLQQLGLDSIYNGHLRNIARGVDTYWMNEPVRSVVSQNISVNASGGDPVFRYGVGFNYKMEPGVMKGSDRDSWGGNVNLIYRKSKVNINNSVFFRGNMSHESPYGRFADFVNANPYYEKNTTSRFLDQSKTFRDNSQTSTVALNVPNPLYNASLPFRNQGTGMEIQNNFNLIYDISSKLKFNAGFQISKAVADQDIFTSPEHTNYANKIFSLRGIYSKQKLDRQSMSTHALLTYGNVFAEKHALTANLRGQLAINNSSASTFVAQGFPAGAEPSLKFAYGYAETGGPSANKSEFRSLNAVGSVNYAYDERFLLDASYRIDGSTSFGAVNPFSPYWSAGLGWNIHKEKFLQNFRVLNRLRVYSNIGVTGNQNMGTILSSSVYTYLKNYNQFGQGVKLDKFGNPDLLAQKTQQISSGLEFGFFNDRLTGYLTSYSKKTDDLVVPIDFPASSGVEDYQINIGTLNTKGYELRLSYAVINNLKKRMNWRVTLTGATLNSKYGGFGNALENLNTALEKKENSADFNTSKAILSLERFKDGYSPYDLWAYTSLGIDPATGREMFVTETGEHTLDLAGVKKTVVGSSKPKLEGVFTNSFNYKGLSLSVMMRYKIKGDVFNQALLTKVENITYQGIANNQDKRALYDRWKRPGDISQFKSISLSTSTEVTSRFIQEENVLSCESISLGYTFNRGEWMKTLGLRTLNLSGYTNDVFRFSTVQRERGIDYPFARSVSFSLRASF
ncbi:SusC/RagA family TonB-linked outer membrane protein [Pedobacter gandavensis]|uniref:SusC/RagA family TonB-linked outer membrane protein n=1 Tax=Pedobacter gandavensis TaxID=2679963 RepID=UPI002931DA03|nr:SusC/RagA family TonB-linked outer membrane protein [Pedobacter gandavensis]